MAQQPVAQQPVAQQPAAGRDFPLPTPAPCAGETCLALPPPAETGKAVIADLARQGQGRCAAALGCRLRLIGAVPGRSGAIELGTTALTW